MAVTCLYWKVRDKLVSWGWISRPRFYMQRHAAGSVRARMVGRGARKWHRKAPSMGLLHF